MDSETYLGHVESDTAKMAATDGPQLDEKVPSCPDWTLADLMQHTGSVHRFWAEIVAVRATHPSEIERHPVPDSNLGPWLIEGAAYLRSVLEGVDPQTPIYSWSAVKRVEFVPRRMAHETAVHRWDAQATVGEPDPIDPELAMDGVDEFFQIHMPAEEEALAGSGETIHLHQTDGDGEWVITLGSERAEVHRGHMKADVAVRATGSDLVLMLWRRVDPGQLEVLGDKAVLGKFLTWMDLD
jgi:uncharacterized protein (TIGR03083 family)